MAYAPVFLKAGRLRGLKRLIIHGETIAYADAVLLLCIDRFLKVALEALLVKFWLVWAEALQAFLGFFFYLVVSDEFPRLL